MLPTDVIAKTDELLTPVTETSDPNKVMSAELREAVTNNTNYARRSQIRDYYPQDFLPYGTASNYLQAYQQLGATMNAGSNQVSFTSGVFSSVDPVGMVFIVSNCGAGGNDLVGYCTAKISSSVAQLNVSADASAPSHARVVYYGHSASDYVDDAIAAMGKRGRLRFDGMSMTDKALVRTSLDASIDYLCQHAFPFQSYTDQLRGGYSILGQTDANGSQNGPGNVGYTRPSMEQDGLISTLTSNIAGAAVFGTAGPSSHSGFNYSNLFFDRVTVLVPTNGTGVGCGLSGFNMSKAVNHQITNCQFSINDNLRYSCLPTTQHIGFINNDLYTDARNYWEGLYACGSYVGFSMTNEHMIANDLQAYGNYDGFQIREGMFSLTGSKWVMHWGKNNIRVIDGPNNRDRFMYIVGAEVESLSIGTHPITGAASWCAPSSLGFYIDDSSGKKGTGLIIGQNMSGSGVGLDSSQLGTNMKVKSYWDLGSTGI